MKACPDQTLTLQAFVDGELDAANALAFERHLEVCEGCSAEIERLRALRVRLSEPGVRFAAPADLHARVRAALAQVDSAPVEAAPPVERLRVVRGSMNAR